jgi:uncharacterized protein (TIGR03000 family)
MFKSMLFFAKSVVLATALLAATAGESSAFFGWHGGWYSYGGWGYGGWGYPYYDGWGYGGWGYPYYGGWGYGGYWPAYYGGYWPGYYGYYAPYGYAAPVCYSYITPTSATPSKTTPKSQTKESAANNQATVEVTLPNPDAQVWFDDIATNQTGTVREYATPARLAAGKTYVYQLRASWMANGQLVTQTRQVQVQPGQRTTVSFTSDRRMASE